MMRPIEVRNYNGDFEDVAELAHRVWTADCQGKTWFPVWDADFFRWQLGAQSTVLCPVAYDGAKLVGSFFSIPRALRVGSSILSIGLASWLMVDPDYRDSRLALRLIEALRQRHDESGLAFSLAVINADPASIAYRFWTRYAEMFPGNLHSLFPLRLWLKFLAPQRLGRGSFDAWQRLAIAIIGPLVRFIPQPHAPDVRSYRATDLLQCSHILGKSSANCEWALIWSREQLEHQLDSPLSGTVILDRAGRAQGMVNYHCFAFQARQPIRAALIDLWAEDGLTSKERARLLGRVCHELRQRGVDLVIALRSRTMPTAAFVVNLFLPLPAPAHMVALFPKSGLPPARPKTWTLVLR